MTQKEAINQRQNHASKIRMTQAYGYRNDRDLDNRQSHSALNRNNGRDVVDYERDRFGSPSQHYERVTSASQMMLSPNKQMSAKSDAEVLAFANSYKRYLKAR